MEGRTGLLFLVVLCAAWACDAREVANPDQLRSNTENYELRTNLDLCALCEHYSTMVLSFLKENMTEEQITVILHNSCHLIPLWDTKCDSLVDQYAPIFFKVVATATPREFCHKVNFCSNIEHISLQVQDTCEFCKGLVSTLLDKLKDSDTEREIIEILLKVCNSVEKYEHTCKRIALEYGSLVFDKAERFLEKTDVCTVVHACKSSTVAGQQAFL